MGTWREKGGVHSEEKLVPKRRGRASKKNFRRRSRRVHERVSERRSCAVLVSLHVWPNLKWRRRLGDEWPVHKMTDRNESG